MNEIKLQQALNQYLQKYGQYYSKDAKSFIEQEFFHLLDSDIAPDILMQLYAKFKVLPKEKDIYYRFTDWIDKQYHIDKNILEIGGGYYPMLAKNISERQVKLQKGTITVYDPLLVTTKLENIKLYKTPFINKTDISSYDLLVGISPCEATRTMIQSAIEYRKEFFIALCGCTHFDFYELSYIYGSYEEMYKKWLETVYLLAKEQEKNGFKIYMEKEDFFPYPLIYSKKQK